MIEIIPNWHPVAVHFTIALLFTASALFVLGVLARHHPVGRTVTLVARWNLALGIAAAMVTVATGWQAYNTVAHDSPSHANMTVHLRWAMGSAAVFVAAGTVAWFDRRRPSGAGSILLALIVVGSGALAVTGWLGGENVYRYGLGVMALPTTDAHMHPGQAGDGVDDDGHPHPNPSVGRDVERKSKGTSGDDGAASVQTSPTRPPDPASEGHAHSH